MAFRFSARERSRMAMASACCLAIVRLLRLGQSILATVDTQAARNSRGAGGGMLGSNGAGGGTPAPGWRGGVGEGGGSDVPASAPGAVGVLEQPSSSAATTPATPAVKVSR